MTIDSACNLHQTSDDELLTLAQEDNHAAFEELMRRNRSSSFKLALSVLRDRQDAEDVVQDSYWSAWRHIGQFHRDSKFSTWMTRIVTNQCLMRLRKVKRASLVHLEDGAADAGINQIELRDRRPSPESELSNQELAGVLHQEIQRLPPLFRNVLQKRYLEELPIEELAAQSEISVVAAKSRLLRARAELKRRMEKHLASSDRALVIA